MSAQLETFLGRLQKVRKTGKTNWMACCPAHDDKTPSLTIAEGSDGRVLVHCFGQQCSVSDIAEAVGLEISDLMPENVGYHRMKPKDRVYNAMDVLCAIRSDLYHSLIVAKDMQAGKVLSGDESLLFAQAIGRLEVAINLAGGK